MKFIGQTDIGQVREGNEDAFGHDALRQVGVLADGMGGLNAGEIASQQAVDAFLAALEREDDSTAQYCNTQSMREAMVAANAKVHELSLTNQRWRNMGTTLVACALDGQGRWVLGHIGDSRAYLLREQQLAPVTKDHSVVQEMIDQGLLSEEEASTARNRHIITRAVGLEPKIDPEVQLLAAQTDDLMLLCSDGLSDMISFAAIEQILLQRESLQGAAAQLVAAANRAGGNDNISVLLIQR